MGPVGLTGPQGVKGEQGDKGDKVNKEKHCAVVTQLVNFTVKWCFFN